MGRSRTCGNPDVSLAAAMAQDGVAAARSRASSPRTRRKSVQALRFSPGCAADRPGDRSRSAECRARRSGARRRAACRSACRWRAGSARRCARPRASAAGQAARSGAAGTAGSSATSSGVGSRLPGGRHLSTLAMYTVSRGRARCARSIELSSWPARPTNGSPWRSSSAPGASPTTSQLGAAIADAEHGLGAGGVQRRSAVQPRTAAAQLLPVEPDGGVRRRCGGRRTCASPRRGAAAIDRCRAPARYCVAQRGVARRHGPPRARRAGRRRRRRQHQASGADSA